LEERVTLNDINRRSRNRDNLKRLNYPRQTYAFSGIDWGEADFPAKTRKKLNILDSPMIISPMPPGALATNDVAWRQTYGASLDCVMSLIDGETYSENIVLSNFTFDPTIGNALPTAKNNNLYDVIDGKAQIQFVVGKDTIRAARTGAAVPLLPTEARSLGIRAPMQMCGWGHTVGMRPTDPEPQFPRRNDNEHRFDRGSWKIGPLDARWDDRRKTWRAFNDLIADDTGQNLGTLVFSTNPDSACGFPFLRGKLEDIWSVRRTFREIGTEAAAKVDDITKSALLVTKVQSFVIGGPGESPNVIAQLSDVLRVHDKCFSGFEAECGSEKTKEGTLAIKTTADFYQSVLGRTGPIDFSANPPPDNIVLGSMYFVGDGECGGWVPGIEVDLCDAGATQFGQLYGNDKSLQDAIIDLCGQIGDTDSSSIAPNGSFIQRINQNRDWLRQNINIEITHAGLTATTAGTTSNGFSVVQAWTTTILPVIENEIHKGLASVAAGANNAILTTAETVLELCFAAINDGFAAMAASILENCDCEVAPFQSETPALAIPPILVVPPEVQPPIALDAQINALNQISESIGTDVSDELNKLRGQVVKAVAADDGPRDDPDAPALSIKVRDPCSTSSITKTC
jgi:hypothetical protein